MYRRYVTFHPIRGWIYAVPHYEPSTQELETKQNQTQIIGSVGFLVFRIKFFFLQKVSLLIGNHSNSGM